MTARAKILEAITQGKLLRVQTTRKCVLLRPFQAGTIGGRWCFDAVVIYKRRQAIERFREEMLVTVHWHGDTEKEVARTLEIGASQYDYGTLTKWEA